MQLETIIYQKEEDIAWIKFNRPQALNAENLQLVSEFAIALDEARKDPEVKVVIIKGEGRAFCAGGDIKEAGIPRPEVVQREHLKRIQDSAVTIRNMGKPVIAAVHGYALGAGCEYAMMCDIRIAAENAIFGFPEASTGATITTGGLWHLPRLVGLGKAKELVFTSDRIGAQEAKEIGLVNKVVPLDQLDEEARKMAKKITGNYDNAIRMMKAILEHSLESSLDTILLLEVDSVNIAQLQGSQFKGFAAKRAEIAKKE